MPNINKMYDYDHQQIYDLTTELEQIHEKVIKPPTKKLSKIPTAEHFSRNSLSHNLVPKVMVESKEDMFLKGRSRSLMNWPVQQTTYMTNQKFNWQKGDYVKNGI